MKKAFNPLVVKEKIESLVELPKEVEGIMNLILMSGQKMNIKGKNYSHTRRRVT